MHIEFQPQPAANLLDASLWLILSRSQRIGRCAHLSVRCEIHRFMEFTSWCALGAL